MRWLAVLAIVIVGAGVYLKLAMSDGTSEPRRDHVTQRESGAEEAAPADAATNPAITQAPVAPSAPKQEPVLPPIKPQPLDRVVQALAVTDAGVPIDAEETPWTEEEATGHLFAISGRYEKGNYPGAIEKAMEVARRFPKWQEDAYKWAIQAHCAMENADKASELFAKMTDQGAIDEITRSCTKWGVKLKAVR